MVIERAHTESGIKMNETGQKSSYEGGVLASDDIVTSPRVSERDTGDRKSAINAERHTERAR